jgi:NitT/TauT family transport system ATP-binding protein
MAADTAVSMAGVARRFVTPTGTISALEDFSLDIAPGEFCAIVGPTGCGKSTTLGLIAGLAKPQGGNVSLFGAPVTGIDPRVGFVFQQDALFPWRNVLSNVCAGPLFRGTPKAEAERQARDWLQRVGLSAFETSFPHRRPRPDLYQWPQNIADGRALLSPGRPNPRAHARRIAGTMGAESGGGAVCDA